MIAFTEHKKGYPKVIAPIWIVLKQRTEGGREGESHGQAGPAPVEMDEADAHKAIEALNGVDFGGRTLRINQAEERRPAPRRW